MNAEIIFNYEMLENDTVFGLGIKDAEQKSAEEPELDSEMALIQQRSRLVRGKELEALR